jgi:hypothetical protein
MPIVQQVYCSGVFTFVECRDGGIRLSELALQSFIIRIWLEETAEEAGRATWRGHVTHVSSGKRQYIEDLHRIPAFIGPYLEAMGVELRGGVASEEERV